MTRARHLPKTHGERLARLRGLYGVVDDGAGFTLPLLAWAQALAQGGATVIQLRFKHTPVREALELSRRIRAELPEVVLLVNDRADLALLAEADGVHVGESDLPVAGTRQVLGPEFLVGATARDSEAGQARVREGADYLGIGPVFASGTKSLDVPVLGVEGLRQVCAALPAVPVVAISGIDESNIGAVAGAGVRAAAVIGAVGKSHDPLETTRRLVQAFAGAAPPGTHRSA